MDTTTFSGIDENETLTVPTDTDTWNEEDEIYRFRYFGLTIAFWTVFVGGIGNTLTILTYVANVKMRTDFNKLLLNLAIVDLLTSTGMIPFHIAGYLKLEWPFGNDSFTTRIQAFSYFCCGYSSIVFLLVITVNRFIGAIFPGKYKQLFSRTRMVWVLLICYLFAPVFLLPFLIGTHPDCNTPGHALTGFHTKQYLCTFVCLKGGWLSYMQFTRILFQFLPLIAMIVLYTIILIKVRGKRRSLSARMTPSLYSTEKSSMKGDANFRKSETQKLNNSRRSRSASVQLQKRSQEDRRMLVISVVICVGFTITFLPSVIVNLITPRPRTIYHMAASNLSWFNSSLNPIIYVILNQRFRQEYWRIIRIILGMLHEKFVHDSGTTSGATAMPHSNSGTNLNSSIRLQQNID